MGLSMPSITVASTSCQRGRPFFILPPQAGTPAVPVVLFSVVSVIPSPPPRVLTLVEANKEPPGAPPWSILHRLQWEEWTCLVDPEPGSCPRCWNRTLWGPDQRIFQWLPSKPQGGRIDQGPLWGIKSSNKQGEWPYGSALGSQCLGSGMDFCLGWNTD